MTLRNANKRAKKRALTMFILRGHKRIEDYLAERLTIQLNAQLKRVVNEFLNPRPSGILSFAPITFIPGESSVKYQDIVDLIESTDPKHRVK